jgi:transcriptional regulator with XRE-family HTH domain
MKFSYLQTQSFADTRERLGLSQRQLADQLGISRTTIAMAETGRRNLPVAALLKIAELEIKMAGASVLNTTAPPAESNMDLTLQVNPEMIVYREWHNEAQIYKLTNKLELMTAQYEKLQMQLNLLEGMLEKERGEPGNFFSMSMELHRDRVRKRLSGCSLMEQALLRNRIALLSAESHLNRGVRQQFG